MWKVMFTLLIRIQEKLLKCLCNDWGYSCRCI